MLKEFRDFIVRGNVVDLAVGIIAGAAFGAVVASLVANIINPIVAFLIGAPDFNDALSIDLPRLPWADQAATLRFGALFGTLITFLGTMAGVFFFIVKPINSMTVRLIPDDGATDPVVRDCPECLSSIPAAARRCRYCASAVEPVS